MDLKNPVLIVDPSTMATAAAIKIMKPIVFKKGPSLFKLVPIAFNTWIAATVNNTAGAVFAMKGLSHTLAMLKIITIAKNAAMVMLVAQKRISFWNSTFLSHLKRNNTNH